MKHASSQATSWTNLPIQYSQHRTDFHKHCDQPPRPTKQLSSLSLFLVTLSCFLFIQSKHSPFSISHVSAEQYTSEKKKSTTEEALPSLLKEAERLWKEGVRIGQKKLYKEALAKFWASFHLVPKVSKHNRLRGTLHFFIGRTYQNLHQFIFARDHYRAYLALQPKGLYVTKAKQWLKDLSPHLLTTLQLESKNKLSCMIKHPAGIWQGTLPATVSLEAGNITLYCEHPGFLSHKSVFQLKPKDKKQMTIKAKKQPKRKKVKDRKHPWIGVLLGGAGLVILGSAGIVGGLAKQDHVQSIVKRNENTMNGSTFSMDIDTQARQRANTANTLGLIGGLIILSGTALTVALSFSPKTHPSPPKKKHISFHGTHSTHGSLFLTRPKRIIQNP